MALVKTNFNSQTHGFHFVNSFEFSSEIDLPFGKTIDLGDVVYGLCGGMCFSALDYFHAGKLIPTITEVDDIDTKYKLYLWDRQLDSLRLPVVPKVIEWMLRNDNDVGRRTSRYEVPKLRRRLDKGTPAVLALIRVRVGESATQNHQVLATGYEFDQVTRHMTVHLYDPNHPGKKPRITMELARPSQGINPKQSTGEPLRGFFIIKYRRQRLPKDYT